MKSVLMTKREVTISNLFVFLCVLSICSIISLDSIKLLDVKNWSSNFTYSYKDYISSSDSNDLLVSSMDASPEDDSEINNFFLNKNVIVKKNRQRSAPTNELKTILMWNDAYGVREYDIGHGHEPFYKYRCPETRCVTTANRTYLKSVKDFDAILIHQRGIEWEDMPKERSPHQRWIHWVIESPALWYMDIRNLNHMFNWTMTYKRNSDFYLPYGIVRKIKEHPEGKELKKYIKDFGRKNKHLAKGKTQFKASWVVSHCVTHGHRERLVRRMSDYMTVDIYGKCGKFKCDTDCQVNLEKEYRFYLSFENSMCDDYVTEKFFNILKYNMIPIVYGTANYTALAPPHSFINALKRKSPKSLVDYLKTIQEDDAKYAEFFWWKDFYEVRNTKNDRAQAYCDLCKRLHDPTEPSKVYEDMLKWWVKDSKCRLLRPEFLNGED